MPGLTAATKGTTDILKLALLPAEEKSWLVSVVAADRRPAMSLIIEPVLSSTSATSMAVALAKDLAFAVADTPMRLYPAIAMNDVWTLALASALMTPGSAAGFEMTTPPPFG